MQPVATVLLWSFTILLGLDIGAGIYEIRVNAVGWSAAMISKTSDGEAYLRFAPNAGRRWWMFMTPLLALVTIAALIASVLCAGPARDWMLGAAALQLLVLVSTFAWFAPTVIQLLAHHQDMAPELVASRVQAWNALNNFRAAFSLIAWLAALRAMTLTGTGL